MNLALFYGVLACVDAGAAIYRRRAGRNALIRKKAYMLRSWLIGLAAGVCADGLVIVWLALLTQDETNDLIHAGTAALWITVPAAVVFGSAAVIRTVPSIEVRTITSAVLFGPLTFMRPYLIALATVVAIVSRPTPVVILTAVGFGALIAWWTCWPWPFFSQKYLRAHARWGSAGDE